MSSPAPSTSPRYWIERLTGIVALLVGATFLAATVSAAMSDQSETRQSIGRFFNGHSLLTVWPRSHVSAASMGPLGYRSVPGLVGSLTDGFRALGFDRVGAWRKFNVDPSVQSDHRWLALDSLWLAASTRCRSRARVASPSALSTRRVSTWILLSRCRGNPYQISTAR